MKQQMVQRYLSSPVVDLYLKASMRATAKSDSGIAPSDLGFSYFISSFLFRC